MSGAIRTVASRLKNYLRAVRPHHWVKNVLVFLPLVAAHRLYEPALLYSAWVAFLAFTFCASSVYLLNDLLDLDTDRRDPQKRYRPLASGKITRTGTTVMVSVFLVSGMAVGSALGPGFLAVIGIYYSVMVVYSLGAKGLPILDVLILASGYALRVVAGAVAIGSRPSAWLSAFCVFLFFSLALVKRYAELVTQNVAGGNLESHARGYFRHDGVLLIAQGIASGYLAVLVLALHTNTRMVQVPSGRYELFWLICLLLLYWISHLWLRAHRGQIREDPVAYALKDRTSLIVMGVMAITLILAI